MAVGVVDVGLQDVFEVASVDDQETVEAFAAERADETLRDCVRSRRASRRAEDLDVLALKDLVEGARELRVTVADQESNRRGAPIGARR